MSADSVGHLKISDWENMTILFLQIENSLNSQIQQGVLNLPANFPGTFTRGIMTQKQNTIKTMLISQKKRRTTKSQLGIRTTRPSYGWAVAWKEEYSSVRSLTHSNNWQ